MSEQDPNVEYEDISKEIQIEKLIDNCAKMITNIPKDIIEQLKKRYKSDSRSYAEIEKEVLELTKKVKMAEQLVNKDIDPTILENSIILIGPMGSGKSTIARLLSKKLNMPQVSLDNREQLLVLYEQRPNFSSLKEFEFFLTATVLTSLSEPVIIDFGAGHSIYEVEAMFLEMKSLLSRFNNVILLTPSEDKEESITILKERKGIKTGSNQDFNNRHFINMPCNYELATITEYTEGKTPEQIIDEIVGQVNKKKELIENRSKKTI